MTHQPATVTTTTTDTISGTVDLLVSGADPFYQYIYSLPIPVDPGQLLNVSGKFTSNLAVTDGAQLFLWYGPTEGETLKGVGDNYIEQVAVEDLPAAGDPYVTASGTSTVPDGHNFVRAVVVIDSCTTQIPGVAVHVSDVTVK